MNAVVYFVVVIVRVFTFGLVVRVILSWVKAPGADKFKAALDKIYEPALKPLRKAIKPIPLNTKPPSFLDIT